MRTTTEYAAEIRAALKTAHGWSSKQVSVRSEYYSMGSSITVVVKDPAIPLPVVKEVAERAESIRRDEATGEILSGGNRYIHVRYSHEAQAAIGARYLDAVKRAVDAVEPGSQSLEPVEGTDGFLVGRPNDWRITIWKDAYLGESGTVQGVAETIGNLVVAKEAC